MLVSAERVKFKRPNSTKVELGLMIGTFGRHLIIDNELNIVLNCSIEEYCKDIIHFDLNEYE